jgi:hypothetical protein
MKRLPLLMDDHPSPLVRVGIYLLVPVLLALTLPIVLLLIIALYLLALFQGARIFVTLIVGKMEEPEYGMQPPHFLDMQDSANASPDELSSSPKG